MPGSTNDVTTEYKRALEGYLSGGGEAALQHAYDLGRRVVKEGLGVLDLARMFQQSLIESMRRSDTADTSVRDAETITSFFIESLSPFEMTHRGFQEMISTLSHRTIELSELNKELQLEIGERKRAEETIEKSLSLLRATLEATTDGILVVDQNGTIEGYNKRLLDMWQVPHDMITTMQEKQLLDLMRGNVDEPVEFMQQVRKLHDRPDEESFDILWLKDGRIFERYSKPQRLGTTSSGRVWSFRDVTSKYNAEQALRALAKKVVEVQEEERQRVSRELHDDICQRLSATKLHMELLEDDLPKRDKILREKLYEVKKQLTGAIAEVRRISSNLRPAALDDFGLIVSLQHLAADFEHLLNIQVRCLFNGEGKEQHEPHTDIALYRIVQEAFSNIAKHAEASEVSIELKHPDNAVMLTIQDNGKGFEFDRLMGRKQHSRGLGLTSMKERAELLGGRFRIDSAPNNGTKIFVEIPLRR